MRKKVLLSILMLGISMVGFSQTIPENQADAKDVARSKIEEHQNDLLTRMKNWLNDGSGRKIKDFNGLKGDDAQQFLFDEALIDTVLEAKSHHLKDVFKEMCRKENRPTQFDFEQMHINVNDIAYGILKKKQGQVDSTKIIVPVSFQAHTVAMEGESNVKYLVMFNWEVEVKKDKKTGKYSAKNHTLVSSKATSVQFLDSDKREMKTAVQNAIAEWYQNIPQTLDQKYVDQAISPIEAIPVSREEISVKLPKSRDIGEVRGPKIITIAIDPKPQIEGNEQLYSNPQAFLKVTPVFAVSVDKSNKKANINSVRYETETIWPKTDAMKVELKNKADAVVEEFAQRLSSYVSERDAEKKAEIEELFNVEGNEVEVSYLRQNGTERITKKPVQKYLSLLKGSDLKIVVDKDKAEVLDANFQSLEYTVNQEFHSKPYSDHTQKTIYLTYDQEKDTFVIDKITVVRNSTELID